MPLQNRNLNELSADDRYLIEAEHARLEQFMQDLYDTCSEMIPDGGCGHCDKGKFAACQGRLPSFFFDFQDMVSDHFDNEEKIMQATLWSDNGYELLRLHSQEHTRLMREVKQLIDDSSALNRQGNTAAAIRHFYSKVSDIFGEHARTFDGKLLSRKIMTAHK